MSRVSSKASDEAMKRLEELAAGNEIEMIKKEEWDKFLVDYLNNVKIMLPVSFRARQLTAGGMAAKAVYEFETKFLQEPFNRIADVFIAAGQKSAQKEDACIEEEVDVRVDNRIKQARTEAVRQFADEVEKIGIHNDIHDPQNGWLMLAKDVWLVLKKKWSKGVEG